MSDVSDNLDRYQRRISIAEKTGNHEEIAKYSQSVRRVLFALSGADRRGSSVKEEYEQVEILPAPQPAKPVFRIRI